MRALGAAALIAHWEEASGMGIQRRAAALLHSAGVGSLEECARLPLGRRDRLLVELRTGTLGPALSLLAGCPACGIELQTELVIEDLMHARPPGSSAGMRRLVLEGIEIDYRLPDSLDLEAIEGCSEASTARALLADRCVLTARGAGGEELPARGLAPAAVDALAERVAADDPGADIQLAFLCPECGQAWEAPLDVAACVLRELDERAARLLGEVHELARAYGWGEAEILALAPARRAAYLECVRA
jgi:hypothetical protein